MRRFVPRRSASHCGGRPTRVALGSLDERAKSVSAGLARGLPALRGAVSFSNISSPRPAQHMAKGGGDRGGDSGGNGQCFLHVNYECREINYLCVSDEASCHL